MSDQDIELHRLHAASHSKFVYFLLGVAVSAIAFAIHQTSDDRLSALHLPIGIAVILWGASFVSGLSGLSRRQNLFSMNSEILKFQRGDGVSPMPGIPAASNIQVLRELMETESAVVGRHWRLQQSLLFAGATTYVVGHIFIMAAR